MPERTESAKRLRDKAEEVRQRAKTITDPTIRKGFTEIAEEYETLARQAERLAREK
jgi:hypothetical protein